MLERYGRGYIEVDLQNIIANVENMQTEICPDTKMIAVIKTDGYGHGSVSIAKALTGHAGLYGFAVATDEEAMELVREGIKEPIIVLGYTFPYAYEEMALNGIEPTVFRLDMAKEMGKAALRAGRNLRVHIKIDTGMGRIGVFPDETGLSFVKEVNKIEGLEIAGIFTHFASADEADKSFAYQQLKVFQEFVAKVKDTGITGFMCHCSNSAAIVSMPEANMDAVRAGITLYGLRPSSIIDLKEHHLKPALAFYSSVVFIKEVSAGFPISYGSTFVTDKNMRIATIPIGYGDGYPRSLSGKGYVLIHGQRAPILGRICMDQMMVDVTEIKEAKEGDKVTLIGKDGEEQITADALGELSGRFNYELVCDLGNRIPRHYI
ncbi:MAG: alanine racemase [Lachnospiraceae bacterium]|nr:alanine racemase [Lachnospiraceae bacterium]MBQ7360848.1 alanine racemase [Lachnospiraceae bacterium]